jgi:NADP-reducing hydrogenase subunit HndB
MEQLLERRENAEKRLRREKFNATIRITVGSATCENAAGAPDVFKKVEELIKRHGVKDVTLSRVGCTGRCDMEPVVTIFSQRTTPVKYITMTPEKVEKVFDSHVLKSGYRFHRGETLGGCAAYRPVLICLWRCSLFWKADAHDAAQLRRD